MEQSLKQAKLYGPGSGAIKKAARRLRDLGWDLPPVMADLVPRELERAK